MEQHLLLNGEFYPTGIPLVRAENRAFRYGDAIFETVRAHGRTLLFAKSHIDRLHKAAKVLHINLPNAVSNAENFQLWAERLLHHNRLFAGARIRLSVYRTEGGLYTPKANSAGWVMEAEKLPNDFFTVNEKGLIVGIYDEVPKVPGKLAFFKSASSLNYVTAGIFKTQNKLDDVLLTNIHGKVIEGLSSNLFLVKDKTILTPALNQGCVEGVMRKQVIELSHGLGYKVFNNCSIERNDLMLADEIFLTNSISGVHWVGGYKNKRFFSKTARTLTKALNEKTKIE